MHRFAQSPRFRRTLLVVAGCALATVTAAACSSATDPSGPTTGSATTTGSASTGSASTGSASAPARVAPDADAQTIARALGCTPDGAPSSAPTTSPGGRLAAGATGLTCTKDGKKFAVVTYADAASKHTSLRALSGLAAGSGLAYCGAGRWLVAADLGDTGDGGLSPAARAGQRTQLRTARAALGCTIIRVRAPGGPAPTSAAPGAKLPANAQPQAIAAKLGCTVTNTSHATVNGQQGTDVDCMKDGQSYDVYAGSNAMALRSNLALRSAGSHGNGTQICASGLWFVIAAPDTNGSGDSLTQAQRDLQTRQMNPARAALGCAVRSL